MLGLIQYLFTCRLYINKHLVAAAQQEGYDGDPARVHYYYIYIEASAQSRLSTLPEPGRFLTYYGLTAVIVPASTHTIRHG